MKFIFNKKFLILFSAIVFFSFFGKVVFAVWNNTFYNPGDTLNPECLPSQANCDIVAPLTSLSGAVLTDQTVGQTIGDTTNRLTKLWATDITVANAINGSITGNAGTVTNGVYTTSDATALAATSSGNKDKYLHSNASTGSLEWSAVDLSGYLPYTGATADLVMGAHAVSSTSGLNLLSDANQIKLGASSDVGLARDSAGVVKVTDGSTGLGGLKVSTFNSTPSASFQMQFSDPQGLQIGQSNIFQGLSINPAYGPKIYMGSDWNIIWSSNQYTLGGLSAGLALDSAGVLKVTNGSTGLGTLKASNAELHQPASWTGTDGFMNFSINDSNGDNKTAASIYEESYGHDNTAGAWLGGLVFNVRHGYVGGPTDSSALWRLQGVRGASNSIAGAATFDTSLTITGNAEANRGIGDGAAVTLAIKPVLNQDGNGDTTDLLINRTETAVGSGAQNLIDAQVGGVSKFSVSNTGGVTINANHAVGNTALTVNGNGSGNGWGTCVEFKDSDGTAIFAQDCRGATMIQSNLSAAPLTLRHQYGSRSITDESLDVSNIYSATLGNMELLTLRNATYAQAGQAAGGPGIGFYTSSSASSNATKRNALIQTGWMSATDASRTGYFDVYVDDYGSDGSVGASSKRLAFHTESDGTGPLISLGGTAVSSTAGTLVSQARDITQLRVKGNSTQTANLLEVMDSTDFPVTSISPLGEGHFGRSVYQTIIGAGNSSSDNYVGDTIRGEWVGAHYNSDPGLGHYVQLTGPLGGPVVLNSSTVQLLNNSTLGWRAATGYVLDTGLARDSAGVVKVTDGSTGLGSLKASSLSIGGAESAYVVTGTNNPNFNGTYFLVGTYGGANYYQSGSGFLWWLSAGYWIISEQLGVQTADFFAGGSSGSPTLGGYGGQSGASGTLTVALGTSSTATFNNSGHLTTPSITTSRISAIRDGINGLTITNSDVTHVLLTADTTNNRIGINTLAPTTDFNMELTGGTNAGGGLTGPNWLRVGYFGGSINLGSDGGNAGYVQAMSGGTNAGTLSLNPYGGTINVGSSMNLAFGNSAGGGTNYQLSLQYQGGGFANYISTRHSSGSTNNNAIDFWTYGNTGGVFPADSIFGMTVNGGNVGVGTMTPSANLQVAQGTAGVGTVTVSGTTTVTGTGTQFLNTFKVGDSITIAATGETKVISAVTSDTLMTIAAATDTVGSAYTLAGGTRFSVLGNGNVGIGNISPGTLLTVGTAGTNLGDITVNGTVSTCVVGNALGAVTCTSDVRLKDNIADLGSELSNIMALRPITFNWKDKTKNQNTYTGLVAQEVQSIYPDMVHTVYGDYLGIDYAALTVPIIKAVQEMNLNLEGIAGTVVPAPGSASDTFVTAFFKNLFAKIGTWLADATNGITDIFAKQINTNTLCVSDDSGAKTCITKMQLDALLLNSTTPPSAPLLNQGGEGSTTTSSPPNVGGATPTSGSEGGGSPAPVTPPPTDITPTPPITTPTPPQQGGEDTTTTTGGDTTASSPPSVGGVPAGGGGSSTATP